MMNQNGKTIKQIADEIGVSKQSVQKRLSREPLCTCIQQYICTIDGTKYIDEVGERIVKKAFGVEQEYASIDTGIDTGIDAGIDAGTDKNKSVDSDVYTVLKTTIDVLQAQLEIKDKQIAAQGVTIENLSAALNAAQALHAGTIQQQLISDGDVTDEGEHTFKERLKYLFTGKH